MNVAHDALELMRQFLDGEVTAARALRGLDARRASGDAVATAVRGVLEGATREEAGDVVGAIELTRAARETIERLGDRATGDAARGFAEIEQMVEARLVRLQLVHASPEDVPGLLARLGRADDHDVAAELVALWGAANAALREADAELTGLAFARAEAPLERAIELADLGRARTAAAGPQPEVAAAARRRFDALAPLLAAVRAHHHVIRSVTGGRMPVDAAAKLEEARDQLEQARDHDVPELRDTIERERVRNRNLTAMAPDGPPTVFIVHGHDHDLKDAVREFLIQLGCRPVILHEVAEAGRAIIEKFEDEAAPAAFAVALFTPDDEGRLAAGEHGVAARARQNVVLELGYFMGRLGRVRVAAVVSDETIERPSDLAGIVPIVADATGEWRNRLRLELAAAGVALRGR